MARENQSELIIQTFNGHRNLIDLISMPKLLVSCYVRVAKAYAATGDSAQAYSVMLLSKEAAKQSLNANEHYLTSVNQNDNPTDTANYGYIITIITLSLAVVILTLLLITGMKRTVRYRSYGEQAELDLESLGEANRETVNALMHISEISEIIESIKTITPNDKLASDAKVQGINTLLKQLNIQQNYREMFNRYFAKMNAPFLRKLNRLHPGYHREMNACVSLLYQDCPTRR